MSKRSEREKIPFHSFLSCSRKKRKRERRKKGLPSIRRRKEKISKIKRGGGREKGRVLPSRRSLLFPGEKKGKWTTPTFSEEERLDREGERAR